MTIYKITYPNGKIYVGQDRTDTLTYFGSPNGRLVEADFPPEQRRDFVLRKEILWSSDNATPSELAQKEVEYIRALGANDPSVGYNRWPKFRQAPHPPTPSPPEGRGGEPPTATLDALYAALAADPLVRAAWLGGSRARGEDDAYSDVDLALETDAAWTPERLGGLWLGGQSMRLGSEPFFHGVLADGTILDVRLGPPGEGFLPATAPPEMPPPGEPPAQGSALDFWLNSMKHAKPLGRGVGGMILFGLHHDAMALMRLWALADEGKDPGPGAFTIFGLTPLVRDHLTPKRLALLGMPKRDEAELRLAVHALRDAASEAGKKAEERWGVPYPARLEAVVRERWPV